MKVLFLLFPLLSIANANKLTNVKNLDSSIIIQMKYFTKDNFVGEVVDGYQANKCLLLSKAAYAIVKAQKLANEQGLSLLVHDCYRPQRGVDHFVRWSKDKEDFKTKTKYYPNIDKIKLFDQGYIAKKSGHTRGSTIDLTLYDLRTKTPIEMGTIYDYLDPLSNTENTKVSQKHLKNRQILVEIMKKAGFKNYSKEWWHYTLINESNKKLYFNKIID